MKPLFLDLGLMQYHCGIHPSDILNEKDLLRVYKGALAEQFVGQELLAAEGSENFNLFYWSRARKSSSAEVDYLFVKKGGIFPIEVKSGPAGKLKSLHIFLKEHPHVERGYVMSQALYEKQAVAELLFIPMYTRFV